MNNPDITGVVLAGGAGRRVANRDKGLLVWRGKPLVEHVVCRLAPQVGPLIISCNRNLVQYSKYSDQVIPDNRGEFQGPLAGLETVAPAIGTSYLLVVTCDAPLLPTDLAERLVAPLLLSEANCISYAHDGVREQYLCAAMHAACLRSLTPYLDAGNRSVKDWFALHGAVAVDYSDSHEAFRNFNSEQDLRPSS